jgi:clan AA aspartic protease (TIGR02281 family)
VKRFRLFTLTLLFVTPFLTFAKMQIIPLTKTPDGHMEIQASINNVEAKFILDTGATGTIIDTNQLNVFGITKGQEKIDGVRVGDAETGKIETFPVDINQFSIGKNQLNIKSIYANDSSGQFASDVMGLIGYDALFELNALLDVKEAELLIPENQQDIQVFLNNSTSTAYQTVSLHKSPMGFSFVDALIENKPVRLLVDSGAPELILDESSLVELG